MVRAIDLLMIAGAIWGALVGAAVGARFHWLAGVLGVCVGFPVGFLYVGFANVVFETFGDYTILAFKAKRFVAVAFWLSLSLATPIAAFLLGVKAITLAMIE